jgi:hypothetical protein
VFGVIGDAMGRPTENLEPADIEQRFGWVESFEGDGTYDTILRDMIASDPDRWLCRRGSLGHAGAREPTNLPFQTRSWHIPVIVGRIVGWANRLWYPRRSRHRSS